MHGVKEDFRATISTVFVDTNPTMRYLVATHVPLPHSLLQPVLGISQGSLRIHNSMETIAVIALCGIKIRSVAGMISKWRQRLTRIAIRIATFAPFRSKIDPSLPTLAQRQRGSAERKLSLLRTPTPLSIIGTLFVALIFRTIPVYLSNRHSVGFG
jgi:hypothetical protein